MFIRFILFTRKPRLVRRCLRCALLACTLGFVQAQAGVVFELDRPQAAPGSTVELRAVFFNDTDALADWQPPPEMVLQWRAANGDAVRSVAHFSGEPVRLSIPVNNFAVVSWRAVVPEGIDGLQAVGIEGTSTLLALDASDSPHSPVAALPAVTPVIDAGRPGASAGTGEPLPDAAVTRIGASPKVGAAPADAASANPPSYATSAWEHFRNALSPYEPIYFAVGTRDGLHARFQISLKYRLFQPPAQGPAAFHENLYVGYTQNSMWNLDSPSKPFYDTTYNPSLFWQSDRLWESSNARWSLGLRAGVEHMSNGRDGADSRSLNAVFMHPSLNYRFAGGSTLSFHPRLRGLFSVADENHDITDYRGHVDWNLRWAQDNGVMVSGTLRQGRDGRNSIQADLAWPLRDTWLSNLNGYLHLQYVHGYGQTLLNYDRRQADQFRVGLMLVR